MIPMTLRSAPLKSATVTEIKNDVKIAKETAAERAAVVKDAVAGKDKLWTGKKSRAEIEFSDRSIARLGANTLFSFDPNSRNMKVERGTALIHVPPATGGARISSPAVTAAIMGDVVAMRVDGKGITQVVALTRDEQGPVQVTFNKTGETRTLEPGQLLTIDPTATKMPDPVTVAVDVFVQSSGLYNGFEKKVPDTAEKEVQKAASEQAQEIQNGGLESTDKLKLNVKADNAVKAATTCETSVVQSTTTGQFLGTFAGKSFCFGFLESTSTSIVAADGSFSGSGATTNGLPFSFNGQLNNDGTWTISGTDSLSGQGTFTSNGFSGTLSVPNNSSCPVQTISGTRIQ